MDYSNPEIPEGINTGKQHPLKDFFILTTGVLGGIVIVVFLLGLFAERLALYIPFSFERELFDAVEREPFASADPEIQTYLEDLTNDLVPYLDLPEEFTINVRFIDDPLANAFATLGGHISIHRGLVELLPNENALAMVVAHELAHIKFRDPIVALGRGVVVGLFLSAIMGTGADRFTGSIISEAGTLTVLGFNRKQEQRADYVALRAVAAHYGHINGADELFKEFIKLENETGGYVPEFFSTHPLSKDRAVKIRQQAEKNQWPITGETTRLPAFIKPAN